MKARSHPPASSLSRAQLHAGAGAMATVCARARVTVRGEPRVARRVVSRAADARRASRGTPRPILIRSRVTAVARAHARSGDAAAVRGVEPRAWSPGLASALVAAAAASAVALSANSPALAEELAQSGASDSAAASPLECAGDPSCAALRDATLGAGAYAPPSEYAEDDPDGDLRRAICPRNPTADICRSQRDRKKQNDSPCKVPLLNACLVWKEGASKDVVLKR